MSETLIDQIKRHEGIVMEGDKHMPYVDTEGKITIGYGHNLSDNGIPQSMADELLLEDLEQASQDVINSFPWISRLNEERQQVIVSMCFNMGIGRLKTFKNMLAAAENGDYELAADEMMNSRWARQVKGRAVELAQTMRTGQ